MKVKITEELTVTDEIPSSSYGIPVVIDQEGNVYGKNDMFPQNIYSWEVTFGEILEGQLSRGSKRLLTQEQILAIEKFLGKETI